MTLAVILNLIQNQLDPDFRQDDALLIRLFVFYSCQFVLTRIAAK